MALSGKICYDLDVFNVYAGRSRGFKDEREPLQNRRTCVAASKCNSLPIFTCTPSLLPLSPTAFLLLLLLFWWSVLTCSPFNKLSHQHLLELIDVPCAPTPFSCRGHTRMWFVYRRLVQQKTKIVLHLWCRGDGQDGGLSSPGSELAIPGGKKGRAPHCCGGRTFQVDRSWTK